MNIGVLKEIKPDEKLVALQPEQISELIKAGHTLYVAKIWRYHESIQNSKNNASKIASTVVLRKRMIQKLFIMRK